MELTREEIKSGNDKIAEFLGWYQEESSVNGTWWENGDCAKYVAYSIHNNYPHQDLPFHRDWNYLMKVVVKLEDMGFCIHSANYCKDTKVKENLNAHIGFDLGNEDYYCDISGSIVENQITRYFQIQRLDTNRQESIWKTIVMFLEYYLDKTIRIVNVSNNDVVRTEKI